MIPNPLDEIFTNETDVNPQLLADILRPFVRINNSTNSIFFVDKGNLLPITNKILLFLVARKVLKLKEKIEAEETSPSEIIRETGLKSGSVHPTLKMLREKGIVVVRGGKYMIPHYLLVKTQELLKEGK